MALAGALLGFWLGVNHEPRRAGAAADSAAIYALLLDELEHAAPIRQPVRFVEVMPAPAAYVGWNTSPIPPDHDWLLRELPGTRPVTLADFERRMKDYGSLRGLLPRARVWPVGRDPYGARHPVDWMPLHAFSHVGFDRDRTQALVYVSYTCGGLCGDGQYVLLERSARGWRIARSVRSWIS